MYTGHCPLGMYVTPTPTNLLVWDAVFFVHQGASAFYLLHINGAELHLLPLAVRLLYGLDPQVPHHLPCEIP